MKDLTKPKLEKVDGKITEVHIKKATKAYIDDKLARLDDLIENAISEDQKAAYENYKNFWLGQLSARSLNARKREKKHEDDLAAAEMKAEEEEIIEEVTQQKEFAARREAREAKAEAERAKMDAKILRNNFSGKEAEQMELKAQGLVAKIKELEAQIKQEEGQDGTPSEPEPEDSTND